MGVVRKSVAYVTRDRRVLFFRAVESPGTGAELPGGTLLPGEGPEEGLLREVKEETGLSQFGQPALLGVVTHDPGTGDGQRHERHFYHLPLLEEPPSRWERRVEEGSGTFTFSFFWVDRSTRPVDVYPGHDLFLDEVLEGPESFPQVPEPVADPASGSAALGEIREITGGASGLSPLDR